MLQSGYGWKEETERGGVDDTLHGGSGGGPDPICFENRASPIGILNNFHSQIFTAWCYNIINDDIIYIYIYDIMMIDDDQPWISVTCSATWTDLRPCAAKLPSKWTANSAALVPPSTWMKSRYGSGCRNRFVGTRVAVPKQWDSLRFCPTKIESLYDMILDDFGWYCFTNFTQRNPAGYELGAKFLPVDKDALAQKAMVLLPAGEIPCLTGWEARITGTKTEFYWCFVMQMDGYEG